MDDGKLDRLIEMVSGLPSMKISLEGVVNNLTSLSNVVQTMEQSVAGIEPLQVQVAAHGKIIDEMQKKLDIMNDVGSPGVFSTPPNKRRMLSSAGGAGSSVSTNSGIVNVNDKLIKLSGMEDNLDRDERMQLCMKVLEEMGENTTELDYRTYGKFGKEIVIKFKTAEQAEDFYTRRTASDSPTPMHMTLAGERKRLWWNKMKTPEQYKKGKMTGKICMAMHKMNEGKNIQNIGNLKVTCDRGIGNVYIGRDRVAFIIMDKDGTIDVGVVAAMFTKFGIEQDKFVRMAKSLIEE